VLDLCHRLGLPVTVEQRDVRAYQKAHRLSLEEAAREVRYAFLADVAQSIKAKAILVGHTQDDHIETVLMHIIRGTGTKGLQGLKPLSRLKLTGRELTVARPLLDVTRTETAAYCRRHHLQPRQDATNLSLAPLRNRIRLELLPALKTYNPAIVEALLRTAATAAGDSAIVDGVAARYQRRIMTREGDSLVFDRAALLEAPIGVRRALFRSALQELAGTLKDIEARHIEEMLDFTTRPAGRRISLPYGLCFTSDYGRLALHRQTASAEGPPLGRPYALKVPGVTTVPGWRITTALLGASQHPMDDSYTAFLDMDKLKGTLVVRPTHPGDRFQPLGMSSEKKVARFLIDARVPRGHRPRVLLVADEEKVVWLVGHRIDDRAKLTPGTRTALRIEFTPRK
jgi:tRNA(Ile)-lysidine synthase